VPYFLLTFTVPQPLRRFLHSHKRLGYEALFHASSQALKKLARDPRLLGSDLPGFTGVLHTWGRQLQYHPHIHYLVPAGAVSGDRKQWLATSENFFLPVQALSVIFRAKFRDAMDQAGLLDLIPADLWQQPWVVHCQAVGDGTHALQYLARYVFRVAIANSRILELKQGMVTFSFRDKKTSQTRRVRLSAVEFIRRFLDHLLPSGFSKGAPLRLLQPHLRRPTRKHPPAHRPENRPSHAVGSVHRAARPWSVLSALWRALAPAGHSATRRSLPRSAFTGQHR
jgi:hypothetical protein